MTMGQVGWSDAQAVLFDLDGTLVRQSIDFGVMRERVLDVIHRYGLAVETLRQRHVLELIDAAREAHLGSAGREEAAALYADAHRVVTAIEVEAAESAVALPGASALLRALLAQGRGVGIVTRNCRAAVERVIENEGLTYGVLLTRDDVEHVKPDPRHLLRALEMFQVNPRDAVMCGDHPMDVLAGKRAGMSTVGTLADGGGMDHFDEVQPDLLVRSFGELALYLGVDMCDI